MSRIFAVNENNDIFATQENRLAILEGKLSILQNCEHVIKTRLGEMIYAKERGIQYLENVYRGSPNILTFEAQARTALLRVDGVSSIIQITTDIQDNVFSYEVIIQTSEGTGVINGDL